MQQCLSQETSQSNSSGTSAEASSPGLAPLQKCTLPAGLASSRLCSAQHAEAQQSSASVRRRAASPAEAHLQRQARQDLLRCPKAHCWSSRKQAGLAAAHCAVRVLTVSPSAREVPVELMYRNMGLVRSRYWRYSSSAMMSSVTAGTSCRGEENRKQTACRLSGRNRSTSGGALEAGQNVQCISACNAA